MSAPSSQTASRPRIFFLDHVRVIIILHVATWHASAAYGRHTSDSWWPFSDPQTSPLFDIIVLITELYMMPAIFFVAGYFTLPSLMRRGPAEFIRQKTKRLIIPFILGVTCVVSVNAYIVRLALGTTSQGYVAYWLTTYFREDLNSAQLWFLPVLYVFSALFCLLWYLNQRFTAPTNDAAPQSVAAQTAKPGPTVKQLLLFAALTILSLFLVNLITGYGDWQSLFGFRALAHQPSRTAINIWYFFLGVYGYRNGWFSSGASLRQTGLWVLSAGMAAGAYLLFYAQYRANINTAPLFALGIAFLHGMTSLCFTVAVIRVCQRWLNTPYTIMRKLSDNAYAIYIIHQSVVVYLQYLLLGLGLSCYIKFPIVIGLGLLLSYLMSEYGLRRIPGLRSIL